MEQLNGYYFRNLLKKTRRRFALSASEQALYQELIDICNEENWCTSFQVSNGELLNNLQCTEVSLRTWRASLVNAGLIKYNSGKSKRAFGLYTLVLKINTNTVPNPIPNSAPNPIPNPYDYNKLNQTKLFVVAGSEEKDFNYLKDLFEQDVGLKMKWKQNGFAAEKFSDGIEQWMIQNNGTKYEDFTAVRRHFLFWIPNYDLKKQKNGISKTPNKPNAGKSAGAYEAIDDLKSSLGLY